MLVADFLGWPAVFATYSAADLYRESPARHMPHYDRWLVADNAERTRIARRNLRENPHIASRYTTSTAVAPS
jgi:hypothetical protein